MIVVGAGLSGLVAAYELVRAGHDVRVLEARNAAGGRAQTLREPFDDGLIAEAGPARIPPDHDRTLGYIDHFGIETSPFYTQEGEYLIVPEQGDRYRETPGVFLGGGRDTWLKIPAGTDALPMAFAEALGDRVRYGSPVTRVVRDEAGVVATYGTGDAAEELKGSHLICTVPLPVIDKIVFDPILSEAKRAAFEATSYQDVTRVYVQYAERNWEGDGLNGWGLSLVGGFWEFWHPTWNQPGPRGILMSYMYGDMARTVAAMEPGIIVPDFIDRFDGFFPGSREVAERGTHFAWEHQPWIGAAYTQHDPPFAEHPELASPEGPIHFAGEHASGERGWMQGALQSGLRAASEIDATVTGERSGAAVAISRRRMVRRFAAGLHAPEWLAA
ncbi:flavin monoamine oxidase family protein [Candidatus Palauibacter sp.]|uniref:flavin monoamine oxidase family protein n=1 Tax=Candidatus Palauibacter sp. TaxID=3101350 RepID=UPI003C6EE579